MPKPRKSPVTVEFYRTKLGRWSWRLWSGNHVNWAGPSKGFASLGNAKQSFHDMVWAVGGDPLKADVIREKVTREMPKLFVRRPK